MSGKNLQVTLTVVAILFVAASLVIQFTGGAATLSLLCALIGLASAVALLMVRRSSRQ